MYITKEEKNINRSLCPHHAVITLKIDIRKIKSDGSLDNQVIGNKTLQKYGMSNKAQLCLSAPTEAECIRLVKETLEKLNV